MSNGRKSQEINPRIVSIEGMDAAHYCQKLIEDLPFRVGQMKKWRCDGRRLAGYFSNYIPEEVLRASGLSPIRIIGYYEQRAKNPMVLHSFACAFVKNMMNLFSTCEGYLDLFDLLAFPNSCDSIRCLCEETFVGAFGKKAWVFEHPLEIMNGGTESFSSMIKAFHQRLCASLGRSAEEGALCRAIAETNDLKARLKRIVEAPALLKPSEYVSILTACQVTPYDLALRLIDSVSAQVYETGKRGKRQSNEGYVCLIGPVMTDLRLLRTLDSTGLNIKPYDISNGDRYLCEPIPTDQDPYSAIASSMASRIKSPTYSDDAARRSFIGRCLDDPHLKGAVVLIPRDCEPYYYYYAGIKGSFAGSPKPIVLVEYDFGMEGSEGVKNRLLAFGEAVGG